MITDVEETVKGFSQVLQVLLIARVPDSMDLGRINGSLCFVAKVECVLTDQDGMYLIGEYVHLSKEPLRGMERFWNKPKKKVTITWLARGEDGYAEYLRSLEDKQKKTKDDSSKEQNKKYLVRGFLFPIVSPAAFPDCHAL